MASLQNAYVTANFLISKSLLLNSTPTPYLPPSVRDTHTHTHTHVTFSLYEQPTRPFPQQKDIRFLFFSPLGICFDLKQVRGISRTLLVREEERKKKKQREKRKRLSLFSQGHWRSMYDT